MMIIFYLVNIAGFCKLDEELTVIFCYCLFPIVQFYSLVLVEKIEAFG